MRRVDLDEVIGSRLTLPQRIMTLENCWVHECDPKSHYTLIAVLDRSGPPINWLCADRILEGLPILREHRAGHRSESCRPSRL